MKASPTVNLGPRSFRVEAAGLVTALCLFFSACTTMTPLSPIRNATAEGSTATAKVGDVVQCTLRDGRQLYFAVEAIEPSALVGRGIRVESTDIVHLEAKRFDANKTLWLVAGIALTIGAGVLWSSVLNHAAATAVAFK